MCLIRLLFAWWFVGLFVSFPFVSFRFLSFPCALCSLCLCASPNCVVVSFRTCAGAARRCAATRAFLEPLTVLGLRLVDLALPTFLACLMQPWVPFPIARRQVVNRHTAPGYHSERVYPPDIICFLQFLPHPGTIRHATQKQNTTKKRSPASSTWPLLSQSHCSASHCTASHHCASHCTCCTSHYMRCTSHCMCCTSHCCASHHMMSLRHRRVTHCDCASHSCASRCCASPACQAGS